MARAEDTEVIDRFEEFYRDYYRNEIGQLAQKYPNEKRSLYVEWDDLYRFDPDLADDFIAQPDQMRDYAEEALRLYDLPVDVKLGQAHVRVRGLRETTGIRDIRARHRGQLVEVTGIIRKATDVRPKITEAAFECQRCGTLTRIPQTSGEFHEPHECQGCERQGPFDINFDQSEFVDAQKIRVQESPEGLRGGETPQSIDVHIDDDITGKVTAGDHVRVTGVLHLDQQGSNQEKSPVFDVYMDGLSVEIEDEQFEDMDITDEDKKRIIELSNESNIYEKMVGSMAPSIYGYEQEKLAIIMQLFSGVTKGLPDGSRIRGDLHMLLIGDPGTGKCSRGNTRVTLSTGEEVPIRDLVEANLTDPKPIDDGVYDEAEFNVLSVEPDATIDSQRVTRVWKRNAPDRMYKIRTEQGKQIEVTPTHPLFVNSDGLHATTADNLTEGDFIAVPKEIHTNSDNRLDVEYPTVNQTRANSFEAPERIEPELSRLLGYIISEGSITGTTLTITNADGEIIEDTAGCLRSFRLRYQVRPSSNGRAKRVICSSSEFIAFLESIEPAILKNSADQRVPDIIFRASADIKREFLRAYVDAECSVSATQREITVASMSKELLENVRSLLLSFGIQSQLHPRNNGSHRLRIGGADFERYVDLIGFVTDRKALAAAEFDDVEANTNTDVVPNVGEMLRDIRETLAISQFDCGVPRTTYQHYERGDRNPGRSSLRIVLDAFEARIERLSALRERVTDEEWDAILTARDELNISQTALADGMDVSQTAISYYERNETVPDGGRVMDAQEVVLQRLDTALSAAADVERLRTLADSDIAWDRIESIDPVEPDYEWVYDLEVEGTHSYVSNNVISHNSQLLQYVKNIAPRSVYTSGKGSSSAGLTAAAVRDDFGDGQQWTLEAGALVLADQGIAAVDELDKMRSEDQSAMHQALEQQEISVSKAGINATLKSRCSLLAAANPIHGRFDEYEPFAEQIDLDPPLISRFDLIFTVTDQPDEERDRDLASHIIETNYAGELQTHRVETATSNVSEEQVENVTENVVPEIDEELLRKYIAHAKRNCYPTMTEEAKQAIQDFYVDLRLEGQDDDNPVPITARKLEALVRLTEASARIRLSDEATKDDAERVIGIVRSSLEDVGVDPETGELDADIIESGTSKTQRDRIKNIKALISDVESEYDEGAPIETVLDRAEEMGMERSKAEHEIEKLRRQGDVYEPTTDHLRTV